MPFDGDSPVSIEADAIQYIPKQRLVIAIGNVEIMQNQRVIVADELIYDRGNNTVTATGEVSLLEPNGNVYFANEVELKDDLKAGVIHNFSVRLANNSKLNAEVAKKINEDVTILEEADFTTCDVCNNIKERVAPFWQIKADRVKMDESEEKISYKNAQFELGGVPVLYTPYFAHAAPGAKRKSGFLRPSYSSMSTLGQTVKVPYYLSIKPNMDATFEPFFTSNEGPVAAGEFRHLTDKGYYELAGSITNPDRRDEFGLKASGKAIRGHIEGHGDFSLDDNWAWGFSGKRSTDDTYLQRYKFGNEDLLTSKAYLRKIEGKNYIGAEAITFQGLNADDDPDTTPLIFPLISTHHEQKAGVLNSKFTLDNNLLLLARSENIQSRRLSSTGSWVIPYITEGGHSFEFITSLRADAYHVDNVPSENNAANLQDGAAGRVIPEAQINWSYPLVKYYEQGQLFLEPVVNGIVSPNGGNPDKIPNEDSQEVELSDVNLFSNNHFTGIDRVEGGPRTNYGLRGGFTGINGESLNFLLGQSYRVKEDSQFTSESGLEDNFSDYVGRIAVNDGNALSFSYRFRMDYEDFLLHRNELEAGLDFSPLRLSGSYILLDEDIPSRPNLDREEVAATAVYNINKEWTLNAHGRRDLSDDGGLISAGTGLAYENECFTFNTQLTREFIRDRDIEPNTSILFQFSFKGLN
jgi:LPS-assembly protein